MALYGQQVKCVGADTWGQGTGSNWGNTSLKQKSSLWIERAWTPGPLPAYGPASQLPNFTVTATSSYETHTLSMVSLNVTTLWSHSNTSVYEHRDHLTSVFPQVTWASLFPCLRCSPPGSFLAQFFCSFSHSSFCFSGPSSKDPNPVLVTSPIPPCIVFFLFSATHSSSGLVHWLVFYIPERTGISNIETWCHS